MEEKRSTAPMDLESTDYDVDRGAIWTSVWRREKRTPSFSTRWASPAR